MAFDSFLELVSASPWTYAVILAVAALDAVLPLVPSETAVISAGVLAGAGDLNLGFVIAAEAAGAYSGDTSAYWLGRRLDRRLERRLFRAPRVRTGERGLKVRSSATAARSFSERASCPAVGPRQR
jgi:membrane-associated protein